MLRRLVPGHGSGHGGDALRRAHAAAGGTPAPTPDAYTTLTGHESLRQGDVTLDRTADSQTLTESLKTEQVSNTIGGQFSGGADGLGKGGFDSHVANGFGGGEDVLGEHLTADPSANAAEIQADMKGTTESPARLIDYDVRPTTSADAVPQAPSGGSLGGNQGSDLLARGGGFSGSELASGNGASGSGFGGAQGGIGGDGGLGGSQGADAFARGSGAPSDVLANAGGSSPASVDSGLGGVHGGGTSDPMARSLLPDGVDLARLPSTGAPGDLGMQGGLGGESGARDALARGLTPGGGAPGLDGAGTVVASSGGPGAGPIWLAAGALARAGGADAPLEEPAPERPTGTLFAPVRTLPCPSCQRQLHFGHRYCGYCGEPLDKTMG